MCEEQRVTGTWIRENGEVVGHSAHHLQEIKKRTVQALVVS